NTLIRLTWKSVRYSMSSPMGESATTPIFLTPRDLQVILLVYFYDGMLSYQIRRRFWPKFGARSSFYTRLSKLVRAGYLRSLRLSSATGWGSGPSLITIGPKSHPI